MTETTQPPVEIEFSDGRVGVTVFQAGLTGVAVIERHGDSKTVKHVPIGTRDAAALTMRLDGEQVTLRPGPGRYMRGSYSSSS